MGKVLSQSALGAAAAVAGLLAALAPAEQALADPAQAPSAQEIEQLRTELNAIRAESAAARAQEAERQRQIDALQRRLDAAAGIPPPPPPTAQVVEEVPPAQQPETKPKTEGGPEFEIYGFAQTDYIQDFKRVDPAWADSLRPSKIPTTPGAFGSDGQSIISVKQSRFGVQGSDMVGGKPLSFKFEFDIYGVGADAGQTTFRLRHAYGSWGPLLAGQTNTLFMDGDIFPNTIDYWGPVGMVFVRLPQIRVTLFKNASTSFAMAIEKPGDDIDPGQIRDLDPEGAANLQAHDPYPDLTAQFRYSGGWGHVQLAGIVRDLGFETKGVLGNNPKGQTVGGGVDATTALNTWGRDKIKLGVVYGAGIASYMNDGGTDLAPEGQPGLLKAKAVRLLGLSAYYDHFWSKMFSTSLGWSENYVYNTSFQEDSAFHVGQYASVNLLFTPTSRLLFGAEFLYGKREDKDGLTGDDYRVQFSAHYSFSSKDFFQ
jgi:hypothetical protein